MKTRIFTGAAIFAVLFLLFWSRLYVSWVFSATVFILMFVAVLETAALYKTKLTAAQRVLLALFPLGAAAIFFAAYDYLLYYIIGASVLFSAVMLFDSHKSLEAAEQTKEDNKKYISMEGLAAQNSIIFYPALPFLAMAMLNLRKDGFYAMLLLFACVCLADVFAYFAGVTLGRGRAKLCPDISPKKTWVGAVGGLIGGLIGAAAVYFIQNGGVFSGAKLFEGGFTLLHYLVCGALLFVFSLFGDLTASVYKRKAGVKDYGKIFPGHGGVMDRFDGTIFGAVALVLYLATF